MPEEIKINGIETEQIRNVFSNNEKEHVAIFTHDNPDPDAIVSAVAVSLIAKKFKKQFTIYYGGEISHIQNKALINVFEINIKKISDFDQEQIDKTKEKIKSSIIFLVDTSMFGLGNGKGIQTIVEEGTNPDVIIDHHSYDPVANSVVINKSVASCSTIMTKLLNALKIKLDQNMKTLLLIGLMKDSDNLRQEDILTNLDFEVYNFLKAKMSLDLYLRVMNCPKPRILISFKGKAYRDYFKQRGNSVVCGIGYVRSSQVSMIAEISDDLMQYDELERCFCIGVEDDGLGSEKYLRVSCRNTGDTINTHDFIRSIFGKEGAGGRKGAGGARIELGTVSSNVIDSMNLSGDNDKKEEYFKIIFESYSEKILKGLLEQ